MVRPTVVHPRSIADRYGICLLFVESNKRQIPFSCLAECSLGSSGLAGDVRAWGPDRRMIVVDVHIVRLEGRFSRGGVVNRGEESIHGMGFLENGGFNEPRVNW